MDRYEAAVAAIYALRSNTWRNGLDRMEELALRLGVPRGGSGTFFHVAGTNGKGSTTAFIQAFLTSAGIQTGGYFSPYVFDLRERVQLNGCMIPKQDFCEHAEAVVGVSGDLAQTEFGAVSEFEAKTAIGFLYWQAQACSHIALETGLGGALDSTNIVDPAVSVLTSVGLDHVGVLGSTVEEIAVQKAGIIKAGRPVVTGRLPQGAAAIVAERAREQGSQVTTLGEDFDWRLADDGEWVFAFQGAERILPRPTLRGEIQMDNASLAITACMASGLELSDHALAEGLRKATVPGRFQVVTTDSQTWVLDGAHNVDSARNLSIELEREYPGRRHDVIYAALEGHDCRAVLRELSRSVDVLHVVPLSWHRSVSPSQIVAMAEELGIRAVAQGSCEEAVHHASSGVVVCTGSFYLLADVARAAGLAAATVPEGPCPPGG